MSKSIKSSSRKINNFCNKHPNWYEDDELFNHVVDMIQENWCTSEGKCRKAGHYDEAAIIDKMEV